MVAVLRNNMVSVLRKDIVGVWYRQKLRDTREASNGGRVRVRIIHGLNISHKNSYTYCKNLRVIETKQSTHAPRGEVARS